MQLFAVYREWSINLNQSGHCCRVLDLLHVNRWGGFGVVFAVVRKQADHWNEGHQAQSEDEQCIEEPDLVRQQSSYERPCVLVHSSYVRKMFCLRLLPFYYMLFICLFYLQACLLHRKSWKWHRLVHRRLLPCHPQSLKECKEEPFQKSIECKKAENCMHVSRFSTNPPWAAKWVTADMKRTSPGGLQKWTLATALSAALLLAFFLFVDFTISQKKKMNELKASYTNIYIVMGILCWGLFT